MAVSPAAVFAAFFCAGRTFFWGDLTYIHFAWRILPAVEAQGGRLPLWNPFNYLGMPLAAEMQCAAWNPLTLPFHWAGFAAALAAFHAAHYALMGALWFLALRRWGFGRSAAVAGAATATLCGTAVSRLVFLNHLTVLAFLPAFLLFAEEPLLLGMALSLSFLGGYPTMTAGGAAAAFSLSFARRWGAGWGAVKEHLAGWAAASALAAALSGVLLLPALELVGGSRRGGGMDAAETLTWSFAPRDLIQLSAPPLIPAGEFDPGVNWWKTCYFGLIPGAAAVLGIVSLSPAAAAGAAAYATGSTILLLGGTNPVSRALWMGFAPLRFVRYPGNMAYLLVPLVAILVARGLNFRRWAPWVALAVLAELSIYAGGAQRTAPRSLWEAPGPVVAALRSSIGTSRFALSPRALHWQRADASGGFDAAAFDFKQRLYGLSNAPFRLEEVGGFGEPLVPARQYAFMDFLFRRPGAAEAARWLPWAGAAALLTPEPASGPGLRPGVKTLWAVNVVEGPALRAAWLSEADGAALPAILDVAPDPSRAHALALVRQGPGRFSVSGSFERPGWLYLAEPLGDGWRVNPAEPPLEPALGVFWKRRVPAGAWKVTLRYEPASFKWGLALTLASLAALALWYHRNLRKIW